MSAERQLHTSVARRMRALVAILLGVVLSTCQVDKLVSPGTSGQLVVTPTAIVDSAAVGSRPLRTQQIVLTSTGTGRIAWTAARVRSSSWAELSAASGTTPDTLSVSFNPAGLFVGEYQDTVILAPAGGSGDSIRVPLRFAVHPCRPQDVSVGASVADSLTASDCEAPHRGGRLAKLFRFSASAGDSLTVLLGSSAFNGYLFFDSSTVGSDPPVAETGQCQSGAAAVCLRYVRLPRNGDFFLEVTSSAPGDGTGAFTLQLLPPRPPTAPTGLAQFAADSVTPIATGGTTADSVFVAQAQVADPDVGDSLALAVEIQPLGTAFTGTPTVTGTLDSGATARVRVTGLADNTSFHWQVRTVDQTGRASSWQAFGGNAEDAADLKIAISQAPNAPTSIGQFKSDGTTAIATGGTTNEATVVFKGTVSDPDPSDQVRLEVEVQPFGTAFTGAATAAGVLVANGSVASVTVTGLADGGQYHWQVRTVDQTSKTSDWVPFASTGQTTEDFNVALPAATLTFETQPSAIAAGSVITPAVAVQVRKTSGEADTTYNGAVSMVIAPGTGTTGATLTGTTSVTAVRGLATFSNLSIDLVGTGYELLANAQGLAAATSQSFDVTPGNPVQLAFTVQPGNTTAGATISPPVSVTVQDAKGNTVTSSTASITVGIGNNAGGGQLTGTLTVAAVNGVASFGDLSIDKAGAGYTLTATTSGLTGAVSAAFDVEVATGNQLSFIVQPPGSAVAGTALSPAIEVAVQDQNGNTDVTSTASISLAIGTNPGGGTLSGTKTVQAVNGVATFTDISIEKTGSGYTLVASASGLTSATSGAFNITPAAAAKVAFTGQPSSVVAGASISPAVTVAVQDQFGNTVTGSSASVAMAIGTNVGGGTLLGTTTVNAVGGVATFGSLSIDKVGTGYTLAASSGVLQEATSNGFNVTPGTESKLGFVVQPSDAEAGAGISPAVQVAVQDAFGNTVTSSAATIDLTTVANPGGGPLSGDTSVASVNGIATFGALSIDRAGTGYTLGATSGALTGGPSAPFTIRPAAPDTLVFKVQPTGANAGVVFSPSVQVAVHDAFGNIVDTATRAITVDIGVNPGSDTLSGTKTRNAVAGIATFDDLSIDSAAAGYTLTGTDGTLATESDAFDITVGTGNKLAFVVQPSNTVTGAAIDPAIQVAVNDAGGNLVDTATNSITLVLVDNPSNATLTGGSPAVAAIGGIATFTGVSLNRVGSGYTLLAFASGTAPDTSTAFDITQAATTIAISSDIPDPSVTGQQVAVAYAVTVTAPGSGTPTGNVTVSDGTGDTCVAAVSAGSCLLVPTTTGAKTLTATYAGDADFKGNMSAGVDHTVDTAATTTAIDSVLPTTSVTGEPVTVYYSVKVTSPGTGIPTGVVTVTDGTDSCTGSPAAGSCQLTFTSIGTGKSITATYEGDDNYLASPTSDPVSHDVVQANTTTTITSDDPDPSLGGEAVTVSVAVTADAPGSGTPTGTVSVDGGTGISCQITLSAGAGSCDVTYLTAGSKSITATYSGDTNYAGSTSGTVSHQVNPAATTTTVTSDANPSTYGQNVTFTAAVTSSAGTPIGAIQFKVNGANLGLAVALDPSGQAQTSVDTLPVGTYVISAEYSGAANYAASADTLNTDQVVSAAATATTVTSSANPSTFGSTVTFTATVDGGAKVPTGTVQFKVDGANLETPVALDGTGQAQISVDTLSVGTYVITAEYSGDANFATSAGTVSPNQVVEQATTTTAVATSLNPSTYGTLVTFTAAVTSGAGTPNGTVQFKVNDVNLGTPVTLNGTGQATIDVDTLSVGTYTITADYGGSTNFASSTGTLSPDQVVNQAATTTSVTSSANPSAFGQNVTFTATVDGGAKVPTGTVQFKVDGVNLEAPAALDGTGQAQISVDTLSIGTYGITAEYGGSTNFAASTGTLSPDQSVGEATTTTSVSSSANPSTYGQNVTFTATVDAGGSIPTGTVQFKVDGVNLETPVALDGSGQAQISVDTLSVGTYAITAEYGGTTGFAASTGTLNPDQVVDSAATATALSSSLNPSTFGAIVTFTASVTSAGGTPTGSVQFKVNGANLETPVALDGAGQAQISVDTLSVGTYAITADYGGATNFATSTGTLSPDQVVNAAVTTTTVTSSVNPSTVGQSVAFTATVTSGGGTPSGNVRFKVDGSNFGAPVALVNGVATSNATSTLAAGVHQVVANYLGVTSFAASTDTLDAGQTVLVPTTTAVTSSLNPSTYGANVTFTAMVTSGAGTPTGAVQFKVDGANLEAPVTLNGSGQAQVSVDTLSAGTYVITAEYGGAGTFAASTDTLSPDQTVNGTTTSTAVASSLNPSTYGSNVTFTATVTSGAGTPTGAVQFKVDGANLDAPVALDGTGQAQISVDTLSVGTYVVTAEYGGAGNFLASTGTVSPDQVVNGVATTTTVSSSTNPSAYGDIVTFTAAVSSGVGTPTGSVQFKVDGVALETPVALDGAGQAQISVDTLSPGTYVITAQYGGATSLAASTGTLSPDQTVNAASQLVLTTEPSASVESGIAFPQQPVIQLQDSLGNPVSEAGVPVTAAVASGGGALSGTMTVNTDASGAATFTNLVLTGLIGDRTLRFTSPGLTPDTSTTITVTAGTLADFLVEAAGGGVIGTQTAGTPFNIQVVAQDASGNTVTGFTETVDISSTGTLSAGGGTTANFVGGVLASHSVTISNAGSFTLTATRTAGGSESGTSAAFTVQASTAGVLALNDGGGQSATVATAVTVPPSVLVTDSLGNPVSGVTVAFSASSGGSVVTGAAATSDASGIASVDSWTLGTTAAVDSDTLWAIIGVFDTLAIPASATAGTATAGQTTASVPNGTAGSPTPITITVRDTYGNKVTGQGALLAGSVTGANTATLAAATEQTNDTTYATSYTPTVAGDDTVTITLNALPISGSPYASTVSPAAAASLTLLDGNNQVGLLSQDVNIPPSVRVEDAYGNPVPDAPVDLAVTAGGGTVSSPTAVADASGTAQVSSWTLGSSAGANTLRAAIPGDTITVSATAQTAQYQVEVRYFGSSLPTSTQQAAFTDAATRWQQIVFGDVPDVSMNLPADWCSVTGVPAINEVIDDLVIYAQVTPIDGAGGILGQAGPCYVRTSGGFPILGVMQFDSADVATLESDGQLGLVIEHEMGHVLGIGSLWNLSLSGTTIFALLAEPCPTTGTCTTDPHFVGARGIGAFDDIGGTSYVASAKVPAENSGGAGTINSHWRETVFSNELMTGYLNAGSNPLSVMTVASLLDMGYLVSYPDADAYTWSAAAPSGPPGTGGVFLPNDVLRLPIGVVDPSGQVIAVVPNRG